VATAGGNVIMIESQQPEDVDALNERSLKALSRAIVLSQGRFSLILVRCNYRELQAHIRQRLHELCPVKVRELVLHGSSKTLYTFINTELESAQPQALMILEMDAVTALEDMLAATNQVRDDFRKSFAFPLVLWVNDTVLQKLMRLAPDFHSWAGIPIRFAIATEDLIHLLRRQTDLLFLRATNIGAGRFPRSSALYLETDSYSQPELKVALKDLQNRQQQIDPALEASLQFILGLDAYANDRLEEARQYYQQSLVFWQQADQSASLSEMPPPKSPNSGGLPNLQSPPELGDLGGNQRCEISAIHAFVQQRHTLSLDRRCCVLFYLGLWWRRRAVLHRAEYASACRQARDYYRQCVEGLQQGDRPELAAKFIIALGEVLQKLEDWEQLAPVAEAAVELHRSYYDPIRLAYSYGLLAEVAIAQSAWQTAQQYAEQALQINEQSPDSSQGSQYQYAELNWAQPHYRSLYLLLLAQAQRHLNFLKEAVKNLDAAKGVCNHAYDPMLYTRILEALRSLYYQQGEYLKAFESKQDQRSIEQQYSLRAFIGAGRLKAERQVISPSLIAREPTDLGAPGSQSLLLQPISVAQEIAASGRQQDVEHLLARLTNSQFNLTIIHGQSGVGKSSIINAGLVPALEHQSIEARRLLSVVLNVYTDWMRELGNCMAIALSKRSICWSIPETEQLTPQFLINQLQDNADRHSFFTILIFDQFEEFFFIYPDPLQRRSFFEFFAACLKLPFVKIVLSLREDYLHYLLECERLHLDVITDDILGQDKRYPLGNFSKTDAKLVIERLTQRSQFSLAPTLIDQLVTDLAEELGEVRPIELQLVGVQLQEDDITTLEQYHALGEHPKQKLVERFLEQVVADCGPPNQQAANLILYLLIDDDKGTRPLRTQIELVTSLSKTELLVSFQQLELILKILVKSGIVLLLPEVPAERYQLVHDYLVALIRKKRPSGLLKQISDLRARQKKSQAEIEQLRKDNELLEARSREVELQAKLKRTSQRLTSAVAVMGTLLTFLTGGAALVAHNQAQRAMIAQINAINSQSSLLLSSHDQLDALVASVRAGRQLEKLNMTNVAVEIATLVQMQQALYSVQEQNRLTGHQSWVNHVSFSRDSSRIASASADNKVRIWDAEGKLLFVLSGHENRVNSVSHSPDGQTIASASDDQTVKLWSNEGRELKTLRSHTNSVTSISYSPNGQMIASASDDGKVKLWRSNGELLRTLSGHTDRVKAVSFSPDGQMLASASWDGTVILWDQDGSLRYRLNQGEKLAAISFSPDSKTIAAGGEDKIVKLWNVNGKPIQSLTGHTDQITGISFSLDGQIIASASTDNTVKLWRYQAASFSDSQTLHVDKVISVSFSPNGILASTDGNNTIKLWQLQGIQPTTLRSDRSTFTSLSFSQDGQTIATTGVTKLGTNAQGSKGEFSFWSPDGKRIGSFPTSGRPDQVKFSPDGKMIAIAENFPSQVDKYDKVTHQIPGQVTLWNLDGTQLGNRSVPGDVNSIDFSRDGKIIAAAITSEVTTNSSSPDGQTQGVGSVRLWRMNGEELKTFSAHSGGINSVSLSPDGRTIATGGADNSVKLWDLQGNHLVTLAGHTNRINSVRFSNNGKLIASAGDDTTIKIWNQKGKLLRTLAGHTSSVNSVGFSVNSQLLVSVSSDGVVKIWNSKDGRLLSTLQRSSAIGEVNFSSNSQIVATLSGTDNTVILWDFNLDHLLERGCFWLDHYLKNNIQNLSDSDRNICENRPEE
jgi:WD40 repeat protein/tetratricopeptide (TPR) repeat protein